jgi:predicted GIY-YIG superfamily endonuclease
MWIYLIHFDQPHYHAQHYLGATTDLRNRIHAHANGHGAALMTAIMDLQIPWQLAKVWTSSRAYDGERAAKDQHNGPAYCPICHPDGQKRMQFATSYPVSSLPIDITQKQNVNPERRNVRLHR